MPASFVTAAGLAENNTFTGDNTFTGTVTFTGATVDTSAAAIAPAASTSGTPTSALVVTSPADLAITASTESPSVYFNLGATRTWATGAITSQRAFKVAAPTYAFAGASTITNAATMYIDAAPTAGTNATITNSYALWVDAGATRLDGAVVLGSTLALGGNVIGPMALTKVDGTTKLIETNATGIGFYGVTPTARQVLATGGGATVDNVISALQALGLVSQS